MKELKIRLMERMLGAELTAHLGYEEGKEAPPGQANRRNCTSVKVLKGQDGELPVAVPRERQQLRAGAGEERPDPDRRYGVMRNRKQSGGPFCPTTAPSSGFR
nr:transposase [Paracoccus ravus]